MPTRRLTRNFIRRRIVRLLESHIPRWRKTSPRRLVISRRPGLDARQLCRTLLGDRRDCVRQRSHAPRDASGWEGAQQNFILHDGADLRRFQG